MRFFVLFFSFHLYSQITYINNAPDLRKALLTGASVIQLEEKAQIDLSDEEKLTVSKPLTLLGNNAHLVTHGKQKILFEINAHNVSIQNIILEGDEKDTKKLFIDRYNERHQTTKGAYQYPLTMGIVVNGNNFVLKNSQIQGFSHAAVAINNNSFNAHIINNDIHHNQRQGFGYGVVLIGKSSADIVRNRFDYNRHSVAGTGHAGQSYRAFQNTFGEHHLDSTLDMHGGVDRKDGTNIAGSSIVIENNTILCSQTPAFVFRGLPQGSFIFKKNKLKHSSLFKALTVTNKNLAKPIVDYMLFKSLTGTNIFFKQFDVRENSLL